MRIAVLDSPPSPLPPRLAALLAGSDHIVLTGGIERERLLEELGAIAPLTAVVGHRDFLAFGRRLPEIAEIDVAGARLLATHMVGALPDLLPPLQRRLEERPPDAVLHGHDPAADVRWRGGTLFVCPGRARAGPAGRPATCAILDVEGPGRITARVVEIP